LEKISPRSPIFKVVTEHIAKSKIENANNQGKVKKAEEKLKKKPTLLCMLRLF